MLATLEQSPVLARLEAVVAGVYLDQEVWLVINNQEIGPVSIEVPTLEDPGHLGLAGREVVFAGWRRASVYVPSHLLLPGENSIMLELRSPTNADYRNRAFARDVVLELSYPKAPREPDLALPLADLPDSAPVVEEEPPLPPVVPPSAGNPTDSLRNFWNAGNGSL
jgi:hypothetical protein